MSELMLAKGGVWGGNVSDVMRTDARAFITLHFFCDFQVRDGVMVLWQRRSLHTIGSCLTSLAVKLIFRRG